MGADVVGMTLESEVREIMNSDLNIFKWRTGSDLSGELNRTRPWRSWDPDLCDNDRAVLTSKWRFEETRRGIGLVKCLPIGREISCL